ncbi:hypothetical protein FOVG_18638 [Fusarium oxysporum f. sp. pisi HDV247]|uniref:Uncharacterized protein n=1 Tax=Fusarium oxysporum f. sp. pisi HDV247 TaxID=1080344 RepID=W9NGU1_FUSOX|nr:hypothetical protein FOVG_18638 [Fusarium oxysporum f. sp. pisi HDV247]
MDSEGSYLHAIKSDPGSPGEVCYPSLPIGHQHQDLSVGPSPEGSEQACGTWVFTPLCHSDSPTVYEPSVASSTQLPSDFPYQQLHSYSIDDSLTCAPELQPYHTHLLKTNLQPDRAAVFQRLWNWSLAISGLEPSGIDYGSPFRAQKPLVWDLETIHSAMQCDQGRLDSRNFLSRGHMVALAEEYEKRIASHGTRHVSSAISAWMQLDAGQDGQSHGPLRDLIIDEMTRELYALDTHYKFNPQDRKKKQIESWIHAGRLLLALVKEMGWGAMLVPGFQLTNDDITKIDLKHFNQFVQDVECCYADWRKELEEISAIVHRILVRGHPDGQILRIQCLPSGSLPSDMNCSLSYWLSYIEDPRYQRPSGQTPLLTPQSISEFDYSTPD